MTAAARRAVPRLARGLAVTLVAVLLGLAGAVGLAPTPAYACSCAVPDPAAQIRDADVIFTGTVAADETRGSTRRIVFAVDRVYKGEASASQLVETNRSGSGCGAEVSGPGPFVVYAQAGGGRSGLTAGLCGGTGPGTPPTQLGAGTAPTPVEEPWFSARTKRWGFIGIGVACLVVAFALYRRPRPD